MSAEQGGIDLQEQGEKTRIKVRYFAIFRMVTGKKEEEVTLEVGTTVGTLIDVLVRRNGPKFRESMLDLGTQTIDEAVIVILNDRLLTLPAGLREHVRDGDEAIIAVAAVGGAKYLVRNPGSHAV